MTGSLSAPAAWRWSRDASARHLTSDGKPHPLTSPPPLLHHRPAGHQRPPTVRPCHAGRPNVPSPGLYSRRPVGARLGRRRRRRAPFRLYGPARRRLYCRAGAPVAADHYSAGLRRRTRAERRANCEGGGAAPVRRSPGIDSARPCRSEPAEPRDEARAPRTSRPRLIPFAEWQLAVGARRRRPAAPSPGTEPVRRPVVAARARRWQRRRPGGTKINTPGKQSAWPALLTAAAAPLTNVWPRWQSPRRSRRVGGVNGRPPPSGQVGSHRRVDASRGLKARRIGPVGGLICTPQRRGAEAGAGRRWAVRSARRYVPFRPRREVGCGTAAARCSVRRGRPSAARVQPARLRSARCHGSPRPGSVH